MFARTRESLRKRHRCARGVAHSFVTIRSWPLPLLPAQIFLSLSSFSVPATVTPNWTSLRIPPTSFLKKRRCKAAVHFLHGVGAPLFRVLCTPFHLFLLVLLFY